MGRSKFSLKIHGDLLRHLILLRGGVDSLSKKCGISRQSIHGYIRSDHITPKQLSNIAASLPLSPEEITSLHRKDGTSMELIKELDRLRVENRKLKMALSCFAKDAP